MRSAERQWHDQPGQSSHPEATDCAENAVDGGHSCRDLCDLLFQLRRECRYLRLVLDGLELASQEIRLAFLHLTLKLKDLAHLNAEVARDRTDLLIFGQQ